MLGSSSIIAKCLLMSSLVIRSYHSRDWLRIAHSSTSSLGTRHSPNHLQRLLALFLRAYQIAISWLVEGLDWFRHSDMGLDALFRTWQSLEPTEIPFWQEMVLFSHCGFVGRRCCVQERSMGGPSLPAPSIVPDDRSATACPESQWPRH